MENNKYSNRMAIASLVCSIISIPSLILAFFALLPSILSIIFGVIGFKKAEQTGIGRGFAITGIAIGIAISVVAVFFSIYILWILSFVESYVTYT